MSKILNIKKNLQKDGFVLLKGFLCKTKEFRYLKNYIGDFLKYTNKIQTNNLEKQSAFITKKFLKNKDISAYLNDNINKSPYLQKLFTCEKLIKIVCEVLDTNKHKIILNNQRLRIQIPGNDNIANLPWHQDSHYNVVKNTRSIVTWISINKITKNMGPIIFKKGSHKLGQIKAIRYRKNNGNFAIKVNVSKGKIGEFIEKQFETEPGDLILIDMNTIHTSGRNLSRNHIKFSSQARYHFVKNFN